MSCQRTQVQTPVVCSRGTKMSLLHLAPMLEHGLSLVGERHCLQNQYLNLPNR